MFLTTTDGIEGYQIVQYLGIIGGEAFEESLAWANHKQKLHEAIQHAVNEMREGAQIAGANAIVGVSIDHESVGAARLVIAYGTAVLVQPTREPPPVLPPLPPPTEQ